VLLEIGGLCDGLRLVQEA